MLEPEPVELARGPGFHEGHSGGGKVGLALEDPRVGLASTVPESPSDIIGLPRGLGRPRRRAQKSHLGSLFAMTAELHSAD